MIPLRSNRVLGFAIGSLAALAGCTTTEVVRPPPELAQARAEYGTAVRGPAARYTPGELNEAKATLDRAEALYRAEPKSTTARTQAYVALRRVQLAEANAGILAAQAQREQAVMAALDDQARRAATANAELTRTRRELAQGGCGQEEQQGTGNGPCAQGGRAETIAIPGAAMFATGSAELTPAARVNLDGIAQTLKEDPNRKVRADGFTDTTGTDAVNNPLSEARADAVRSYLVSQGVDASRIQTAGHGSSQQIADDATAKGRQANRRVSITVEPATGVAEPMKR